MRDAVVNAVKALDVLVLAAAVADFKPAETAAQKLKRRDGVPSLPLVPTVDILMTVRAQRTDAGPRIVGFAAETQDLLGNAREKLRRWGVDLVVANDVSLEGSGFGSDSNKVTILRDQGPDLDLPLLSKAEVAHRLLDEVVGLRSGRMSGVDPERRTS
jgi:phosphopantothenoylcysteine decarboxylase/phosphopantothenate--cysteine ligase